MKRKGRQRRNAAPNPWSKKRQLKIACGRGDYANTSARDAITGRRPIVSTPPASSASRSKRARRAPAIMRRRTGRLVSRHRRRDRPPPRPASSANRLSRRPNIWLVRAVRAMDCLASSERTRAELGWTPHLARSLADLDQPYYFKSRRPAAASPRRRVDATKAPPNASAPPMSDTPPARRPRAAAARANVRYSVGHRRAAPALIGVYAVYDFLDPATQDAALGGFAFLPGRLTLAIWPSVSRPAGARGGRPQCAAQSASDQGTPARERAAGTRSAWLHVPRSV